MQGGGGIRGPSTGTAGGTIDVQVQGGATEVEVGIVGGTGSTTLPVGPGGRVSVPVPPDAGGHTLYVATKGNAKPSFLRVEVVSND